MSFVVTVRVVLPCPTCDRVGPRLVAVRLAGPLRHLPRGVHRGHVQTCTSCWHARARALSAERERLRALGILDDAHASPATWEGVPLGDSDSRWADGDPLTDALDSALLREGIAEPCEEPAILLRVDEREAHALEPAEAGASR